MLDALSDSLVLGMRNLLIEDLSLRVIFPRLLLRQRFLHSTITVADISIATVAIITEKVIPAIITDSWLAGGITLGGEGETLIGGTMVVASCSEETAGVADEGE